MKRTERIIHYKSFDDDFAGTDIRTQRVGAEYRFVRKSVMWRISSLILYNVIARPVVFVICKFGYGLRVKNRRALKEVRKKGFFLYGNHTQALDAFVPHIAAFPHKVYIISNPDAVSIRGLKTLVQLLGCLPVPCGIKGLKNLNNAVEQRYNERGCITVFPEAHIWPYYTGIRPFQASAFAYPVKLGAPVVAMAMTYRRRSLFGIEIKPGWTVSLSKPFYPNPELSVSEARCALYGKVYEFLSSCVSDFGNYEYIKYKNIVDVSENSNNSI